MRQIIIIIIILLLCNLCVYSLSYYNYSINNSSNGYKISIVSNIINTTIHSITYLGYNYGINTNNYNIYFLNNSNLYSPLRFEKDGYFFIYDISQGAMTWIGRPGQPAVTDTLGSGASSNSLDTIASVSLNKIIYSNAFYNTNVTYELINNMIKETFVLSGVPTFKTYDYLQYSGNIRFNASLNICIDTQCYKPSGIQDDFETSGKIYFRKPDNVTVFYLNAPIIKDSANKTIFGLYSVHGSNAQMNFWLRINRTWLQTATFPVYIDPTITIDINNTLTINLSDEIYNPLKQIILNNISGTGEVLIDTEILNEVKYAINPLGLNFSTGQIDIKNSTSKYLLKCLLWEYFSETCGIDNTGSWTTIKLISIGNSYDFNFNNLDPAYFEVDEDFELNTLNYIEGDVNNEILLNTKLLQSYNTAHQLTNNVAYTVNDITCNIILNNVETNITFISMPMLYNDFTETYEYSLLINEELWNNNINITMPYITNYIANIMCTGGKLGATTKTDNIFVKINQ